MKLAAYLIFTYIVFALLQSSSGVNPDSYFGCFRNFSNRTTFISQSMTIDLCIETCRNNRSTYAGLQGGDQCLCEENFGELVDENHCTDACSGSNVQFCGGKYGTAVHSVCSVGRYGIECDKVCHCNRQASCHRMTGLCPTGCDESWMGLTCDTANASPAKSKWYIGCYADSDPREMVLVDSSYTSGAWRQNSINNCLKLCANFTNTYIGAQYSWDCFCGERYSKYGPSDRCTMACRGDASQICGGEWASSVYSVCPSGRFSSDCLARCNCANDARCIYINGTCPHGCKPGWTGESCNVRNCNDGDGDCSGPNEVCETVDLKYTTVSRCGCRKGYTRYRPWDNCTGPYKDECSNGESNCDASSTVCTNLGGGRGYECSCKTGFQPMNSRACSDIDECLTGENQCDNVTSTCANLVGSYRCTCIYGYERSTDFTCSPKSSLCFSLGSIIGAVVGTAAGVTVLFVIIGTIVFRRRRRESQQPKDSDVGQEGRNHIQDYEMASNNYEELRASRIEGETPYESIRKHNCSNR